jgi:sn-glycerol 3-phosphate transport system substrate-binding protein
MTIGRLILPLCACSLLSVSRYGLCDDTPESPVEIRLWQGLGGQIGSAIQAQVDRFNQAKLGVRVQVAIHNGYANTLKDFRQAIAAGDPPEVAVIEVHSLAELAAAGEIRSLQELINNDEQLAVDDLLPGALMNTRWNYQIYGLPVTRSTPVLYFNKRRFRAAGLDPDKPPQTWDEFRKAARQLTTDPLQSYGFAASASAWHFESLVFGAGGSLIDKNDRYCDFVVSGSKPLQVWADMIFRDQTARVADRSAFVEGQAAMLIESTAMLASFESINGLELGTAFVPHQDGRKTGVPTGGGIAVMPAKLPVEKERAAWKFLTWFIATEQTAEICRRTGYFPLRKSAVQLLEKEGFYARRPNYRTSVDQLEYAQETPALPIWRTAMTAIGESVRTCLEQDDRAETALIRAAEKVDQMLRESKKRQE